MNLPVKLSDKAVEMVKSIMQRKGIPEDYSLRIGIRGGAGCLGVNYMLGFDKAKKNDQVYDLDGIPILIEKKDIMFLLGMTVDWVTNDGQSGFTFFKENPVES